MEQVDTHDLTASTRAKAPRPEDHVIVLFGATGDLVKRKILPGLYRIVERPFRADLASAKALNSTTKGVFDESAVFRIDHFLAK